MKINLPNQITIARLFLSVIVFACLALFSAREPKLWLLDVAMVLFVIAALTDALDGYLARRNNQITSLGRILDPFVDKILVGGTYIMLAGDGFVDGNGVLISDISAWIVVIIISRELLVSSLRGVSEAGGQSFGANIYGKAKMVTQSVTAVWILVTLAHPEGVFGTPFFVIGRQVMVWITVVITLLSMLTYLWSARKILIDDSKGATR